MPLSNGCTLCFKTRFTINTKILSLDHYKTHNSKDIAYYMVIKNFMKGNFIYSYKKLYLQEVISCLIKTKYFKLMHLIQI